MSSRMTTRSRGRGSNQPESPEPNPEPETVPVEPLQPTRRSQRLIARRASPGEGTSRASERAAADATPPEPAPLPVEPLRRAAAGRRAAAVRPVKRQRCEPQLTGLWDALPLELVDMIIDFGDPRQLSRLETTCRYFKKLDNVCYERLKLIPRAKGMEPNRSANECWASILFFISSQSNAAAQATSLTLGNTHSAALLVPEGGDGNHNLYTFGRSHHGALGHTITEPESNEPGGAESDDAELDGSDLYDPEPLCIGYQACGEYPGVEEEITPAVVTCGNSHTTCITRRGVLYTFGLGNRGELGHGPAPPNELWFPERTYLSTKPHLRIVSLACGANHTLAISEVGTLWACGHNSKGQLGIGNVEDTFDLRPLYGALRGYRVVAAAAGQHHSMALSSDGSLFTWGCGSDGQLGQPQLHAMHLMMQANAAFNLNAPRKIDALDPFRLQPWKRVTAISSGKHHCMAVTVCGELLGFGRNKNGELGAGYVGTVWVPTPIAVSWTGESSAFFRTSQVACGATHTLALVQYRGKMVTCAAGACSFGQLGQGDQARRLRFAPIKPLVDADIVTLQAGDYNSGAIGADGSVYLWGRNDHGQLGLGHDCSQWAPVRLESFRAVHPDRTLRKNKRSLPRMRRIPRAKPQAAPEGGAAFAGRKAAFFRPAASGQQPAVAKHRQHNADDTATSAGAKQPQPAPAAAPAPVTNTADGATGGPAPAPAAMAGGGEPAAAE
ncbi:MAG: regulator of chromosome condensation 1/beta-lactamase-inhibitor protein II [Monoraphidium minutum]|nr:MAG: regulator of chromosome condensation 1/beta-lactamase-inhibitor protein II [Monoraphidium minutum]